MSRNTGESPIRRAAGMIAFLWGRRKRHSQEVYSLAEAVATAAAHEPQLSEEALRYAASWAQAAHKLREMSNNKDSTVSFAQMKIDSGVTYYSDRDNWPEDV